MKIAILGAGESGVGAAILAKTKEFEVFVSDYGKIGESYKMELEKYEIEYEEQQHTEERILNADLVIKSPGIPDKAPIVKKLTSENIEIIDEIEFGFRQLKIKNPIAKIIAITGSNGKTTTTSLTYNLFKSAGLNVAIGGNIGQSFAKQVALNDVDYYVLEISSFQLDYCFQFQPNIAILLNISPDHLDRYNYEMSNYVASKFRITQSQTESDLFIHNTENEAMQHWLKANKVAAKMFSISNENFKTDKIEVGESRFKKSDLTINGPHNHFNTSCAIAAAKSCGISDEAILKGLKTFQNEPHRMEFVRTYKGVDYINDSKATNIDAVKYALMAMTKTIVWVVGGIDKGNGYEEIRPLVEEKVRTMICLAADDSKFKAAFPDLYDENRTAKTAKEAVKIAESIAKSGEVVLLSPACSSFDLFLNYRRRGDLFRTAVQELGNEQN
ncbi:MAG: UDP-N-acetylmuramoyl-L-alanine--D-glutamate ligase [Saprospiraceae bacterium]